MYDFVQELAMSSVIVQNGTQDQGFSVVLRAYIKAGDITNSCAKSNANANDITSSCTELYSRLRLVNYLCLFLSLCIEL